MSGGADAWSALLALFLGCFHQPTAMLFTRMAVGWVLCPGRHTLTRVYPLAEPQGQKAHDAYHRFFRAGAWCMAQVWERLSRRLVERFHPQGVTP